MTQYLVVRESRCTDCDGAGSVQSGIWAAYFEAERQHRERVAKGDGFGSYAALESYYRRHNLSPPRESLDLDLLEWKKENGIDDMGAEFLRCDNCDGAGIDRREVSLTDALAAILAEDLDQRVTEALRAAVGRSART